MKKILLAVIALFAICTAWADETFSGYTVANEGAWCWFADPRATHYHNEAGTINMSYIGYIDVHGSVKATQYNWLTGEKQDILVRSYFQPDDHNNPTFLVLPDERVLIIYSRHTDESAFYYRVSLKPGDISQLGDEKRLATNHNTTYPSPFIMSDDPTHWYLCWRGINWHPTIARLTMPDENGDCKFEWGPYQMVQSTGARPYAKYYSNGKDKLYVTYTTGHPDNESPNWVYFNVININKGGEPTLEDIKGTKLSTIKNGAFKVNKESSYKSSYPNTVVDAPSNGIRDWVWQIALDKNERPHIAMVRINSGKTQHEYYHARWTGSAWALTDICDGGGKFHPSNTEHCYSGGEALDQQNPNIHYVSKPTQGTYGNIFEIWKYTLDDNGKVTGSEQITKNSMKNNVRPFLLPNSEGTKLRLSWMHGDYQYWIVCKNYPNGYPTSIMCDYDFNANAPQNTAKGWSYTTTLEMDANKYYGTLLTLGDVTYSLNQSTHKPEVKIGDKTYSSSNQLYTSDAWQTCPATTDGKSYYSILNSWTLSLVYNAEKKQLTTYRNGIIDQVIDVEIASTPEGATNGAMSQQDVQKEMESAVLNSIYVPEKAVTDIVLPTKKNGERLTWTSSNPDVINAQGYFTAPKKETQVTLTVQTTNSSREFTVTAMPRNVAQNKVAEFLFDGNDKGITLNGNAKLTNGKLDLTANTASGFSTNGYAVVAPEVMDSLRSYTIMFEVNAKSLSGQPRLYDFGFNSGNSVFCRANGFCAGIKYAGGTTTMTNSSSQLTTNKDYKIAITYDAQSKTTTIYVDGEQKGKGTENQNEPYMISMDSKCVRNYIGRTQWWDDSSQASNNVDFVGTIDNFQIYNIALTQKEVCKAQDIPFEYGPYTEELVNGDFEGTYSPMANSGVTSDRAIYVPNGWTVEYLSRDVNDLTALKDGDLYYSNFFSSRAKPENAGNQTLWIRQRWNPSLLTFSQNVLLPEGDYELTADVYASTSTSNTAYLFIDESKATVKTLNSWENLTIEFSSNGEEPVKIGVTADHSANEFICGFDNVTVKPVKTDAIDMVKIQPARDNKVYDLTGRRTNSKKHGIYITNGKKVVK